MIWARRGLAKIGAIRSFQRLFLRHRQASRGMADLAKPRNASRIGPVCLDRHDLGVAPVGITESQMQGKRMKIQPLVRRCQGQQRVQRACTKTCTTVKPEARAGAVALITAKNSGRRRAPAPIRRPVILPTPVRAAPETIVGRRRVTYPPAPGPDDTAPGR